MLISRVIYQYNVISMEIPTGFSLKSRYVDSKVHVEKHTKRIARETLKRKSNEGELVLSDINPQN